MGRSVKPNHRAILALRVAPGKVRERVKVEGIDGLVVDVTKAGPQSFYLRYWSDGAKWKSLGKVDALLRDQGPVGIEGETATRLAQVIATARRDMAAIQVEKRDLVAERTDAKAAGTLDQAMDDFLAAVSLSDASRDTYRGDYDRHVKSRLGSKLIADLRRRDVADAITRIKSPTQARKCYAVVRRVLNWCVSQGRIEASPANRIEMAGEEKPRQRAWLPHEIRRFWLALEARQGNPTAFALSILVLSGRRLSDVAEARRACLKGLDSANPYWEIPDPKNDDPDVVALTPTLVRLFRAACALETECAYVFAPRAGSKQEHIDPLAITRERARINRDLGIEGVTTHDLRTTINSALADLDFDKDLRKGVIGHKPDRDDLAVSTYLDVNTMRRERAALQAFENELRRLVASPPQEHERWGAIERGENGDGVWWAE